MNLILYKFDISIHVMPRYRKGYKMQDFVPVLKESVPKFKVPVYPGFPFGHHTGKQTIDFSRNVVIFNGVLTFPKVK